MPAGSRVDRHVAAFNDAVGSGDWAGFAARFADGAELSFVGVPVGPFRGRDAIAAAYGAQPPTDSMDLLQVDTHGDVDLARFAWRNGGTGTMRLTWAADLVAGLVVSFDD